MHDCRRKRRQQSKTARPRQKDWKEYERKKRVIQDRSLSPAEYQAEIKELADRLHI